jgi:hypothetical protein
MIGKRRPVLFVLAIIAACDLVFLTFPFSLEFLVSHCLSANNGSFDYAKSSDLRENHVFIPYRIRHGRDKDLFPVSLASILVTSVGCHFSRCVS